MTADELTKQPSSIAFKEFVRFFWLIIVTELIQEQSRDDCKD